VPKQAEQLPVNRYATRRRNKQVLWTKPSVNALSTGARIEFNPNQPRVRVIFSLVHEIGQALFLNFGLTIRNRLKMSKRDSSEAESSER
jgi:hypothetical protein